MDTSAIASLATELSQARTGDAVQIAVLRKAMDIEAAGALQVLQALPPLANPANKAQKLHVLEVIGHVYKANYRMRMLYAASPGPCLLMGQEILELSSF